jgi:hypothetical protein
MENWIDTVQVLETGNPTSGWIYQGIYNLYKKYTSMKIPLPPSSKQLLTDKEESWNDYNKINRDKQHTNKLVNIEENNIHWSITAGFN